MISKKPKHDQLFRKALENPLVANEFLQTHLPVELLKRIDIESVKLEKDSFIEPNLSTSISDILFSVRYDDNIGYPVCMFYAHETNNHVATSISTCT